MLHGVVGEVVNTADCGSVMQGFDPLTAPHLKNNEHRSFFVLYSNLYRSRYQYKVNIFGLLVTCFKLLIIIFYKISIIKLSFLLTITIHKISPKKDDSYHNNEKSSFL